MAYPWLIDSAHRLKPLVGTVYGVAVGNEEEQKLMDACMVERGYVVEG